MNSSKEKAKREPAEQKRSRAGKEGKGAEEEKTRKKRSPSKEKLDKADEKEAETKERPTRKSQRKPKKAEPATESGEESVSEAEPKKGKKEKAGSQPKEAKKGSSSDEKAAKPARSRSKKSGKNSKPESSKSETESTDEKGTKKPSKSKSSESISAETKTKRQRKQKTQKMPSQLPSDEEVDPEDETPETIFISSSRSKNNLKSDDQIYGELDMNQFIESSESSDSEQAEGPAQDSVQYIFAHKVEGETTSYFVKYFNRSYKSCEWITEEKVKSTKHGEKLQKKYRLKHPNESPNPPYYDPLYEIPEKIIGIQKYDDGSVFYLVKWMKLDYDMNTYETKDTLDASIIKQYEDSNRLPSMQERFIPPHPSPLEWKQVTTMPKSKSGFSIRPYQLEGVNFLSNSWFNKKNAILADEMGLGKTCQSISFLNYLVKEQKVWGPFLVIAPLSTIAHWEREVGEWTNLKSISYYGIKTRREQMRENELFYANTPVPKFQVMLTTYEFVISDEETFSKINWQVLVVDEAHRLKNHDSKLIQVLRNYSTEFKILLTGTPLQNNTGELWSLLNFIDEKKFNDLADFQEKFGQLNESDQIIELQSILKPLMLRRLKGDVEKGIKPLEEVIIECAMTQHQKGYYQSIFSHNMEYLTRGAHKANNANLHNIFMELRKVCNHPYLLKDAEEQILIERRALAHLDPADELPTGFVEEALIRSSGKMILLDKLLSKLKKDGHRVLVFSQMTRMLDILQDYLLSRGYQSERLDGNIRGNERQAGIDRFNQENSDVFVFLLCTHAGGLGINLTTADTVIIYDSDWNPQNDIQATARCHRIGQTKEVKVYRFITAKSYERTMFDRAAIKLGLDHAVLESNKVQKTEEIEKLLRLGAYYAFQEDDQKEAETYGEEDIDSILNRSTTIRHENVGAGDGSTFSKAQFEVDDEVEGVDLSAPDFWQKYLPVVVEDDLYDGLSIAERRRFKREGELDGRDLSASFDSLSIANADRRTQKDFFWSKKKMQSLMVNLWRFGWGRWRIIYESCKFNCEISEVKSVVHVIIKWLCEASPNQSQILEAIYKQGVSSETEKFESKFDRKRREEYEPLVISNAAWKIGRLEFLHFLNSAVQSCSNPPEGLVVGNVNGAKPADWWTESDDKLLLYGVFLNGFGMNESIVFTHQGANSKLLTQRLKLIIINLKNTYYKYKEEKNVEIPFNFQTLSMLQDTISKKDHKIILFTLQHFGYTNPAEFREICGLSHRTEGLIQTYVEQVIKYCHDVDAVNLAMRRERKAEEVTPTISSSQSIELPQSPSIDTTSEASQESLTQSITAPSDTDSQASQVATTENVDSQKIEGSTSETHPAKEKVAIPPMPDSSFLVDKILFTTANRIVNRIKLFDQIREQCDDPRFTGQDKDLINYFAEHGFIDLNESPFLEEVFGEDISDKKIMKKIKEMMKPRHERKIYSRQTTTREREVISDRPVVVPQFDQDENGNPLFPIKLSNSSILISLGKVVYEKPGFHSARYVYPDGYMADRLYTSFINPAERVWYRSSIIDAGGDVPVFRVALVNDPNVYFEGMAPSNPWICVIKAIEEKLHANRALTISGPDYFCLSSPITIYLMSRMENIEKCDKYVRRRMHDDGTSASSSTTDAPINGNVNPLAIAKIPRIPRVARAPRAGKVDFSDNSMLRERRGRKPSHIFSSSDDNEDDEQLDLPDDDDEDEHVFASKKKTPVVRPKLALTFNFAQLLSKKVNDIPSISYNFQWLREKNESILNSLYEVSSNDQAESNMENENKTNQISEQLDSNQQ